MPPKKSARNKEKSNAAEPISGIPADKVGGIVQTFINTGIKELSVSMDEADATFTVTPEA